MEYDTILPQDSFRESLYNDDLHSNKQQQTLAYQNPSFSKEYEQEKIERYTVNRDDLRHNYQDKRMWKNDSDLNEGRRYQDVHPSQIATNHTYHY